MEYEEIAATRRNTKQYKLTRDAWTVQPRDK